jgi:hypothetical protein
MIAIPTDVVKAACRRTERFGSVSPLVIGEELNGADRDNDRIAVFTTAGEFVRIPPDGARMDRRSTVATLRATRLDPGSIGGREMRAIGLIGGRSWTARPRTPFARRGSWTAGPLGQGDGSHGEARHT